MRTLRLIENPRSHNSSDSEKGFPRGAICHAVTEGLASCTAGRAEHQLALAVNNAREVKRAMSRSPLEVAAGRYTLRGDFLTVKLRCARLTTQVAQLSLPGAASGVLHAVPALRVTGAKPLRGKKLVSRGGVEPPTY